MIHRMAIGCRGWGGSGAGAIAVVSLLVLSLPSSPGFQMGLQGGLPPRGVGVGQSAGGRLARARLGTPCASRARMPLSLSMLDDSSKGNMAESTERSMKLPWKDSIGGPDCDLLYMPFIEWQLQYLRQNIGIEDLPFDAWFARQESDVKPAIIESWQFKSEQFRKIRMTYIDAGVNAQVFNCVWYPDYCYDMPIFGIDFLSFGKKKVLAVLDFQPLTQDPEYIAKYIDGLKPLREQYIDLCGRMSSRFYDENKFFSEQLLFGKFDHAGPVMRSLFPAMKQYTEHYTAMLQNNPPNYDPDFMANVKKMQEEYDVYSAEKDPAIGLFTTYWGADWATRFTHEFLFSDSGPPQAKPAAAPQRPKQAAGDAKPDPGALWVWDLKLLDYDDAQAQGEYVDLYQPFWDYTEKAMQERLGDKLSTYSIPEGFECKEETVGKGSREQLYSTTSYGYASDKLRQIRTCIVKGGRQLQVLNFVMFPHLNYDLPILGIDLVSLPGGHLIVIDHQPLFDTDEYRSKYSDKLMATHAKHAEKLPWGGDLPEGAKQFFSPAFIWTRPSEDKVVQEEVFECVKDYLHKYLDFVEEAEPVTDPAVLQQIREKHEAYIEYRMEHDPAHGMFRRLYGEEWTEQYVQEFLFDLGHKVKKGEYPLGEKAGVGSAAK